MPQKETVVFFLLLEKGLSVDERESETHDQGGLSVETRRGSITTIAHRTPPTFESLSTLIVLTLWLGYFLCGCARRGKSAPGAFLSPGGGTVINVLQSSLMSPAAFSTKRTLKIGI